MGNMGNFEEIAKKAVKGAGSILREHYNSSEYHISEKKDKTLVTEADENAERYMRKLIGDAFPEHAILGEEGGGQVGDEYSWLIDPLDGTTNFTMRIPIFGVAIALLHKKQPILAMMYNPILEEFYYAETGKGAFLNARSISVSNRKEFDRSLWSFGMGHGEGDLERFENIVEELVPHARTMRMYGATAWAICKVASGEVDGHVDIGSKAWDKLAAAFIAQEAGAELSGIDGEPFALDNHTLLVSNKHVHKEALKYIS